MEYELGEPGKAYAKWAAKMAVDLDIGVPWVMCKQDDAPDPIVSVTIECLNCSDSCLLCSLVALLME